MKSKIAALMSIVALMLAPAVFAKLILLEGAYEVDNFQVSLNERNIGHMTFRACPEGCASVRLRFTKDSKVFLDETERDVDFLKASTAYPATILYDPESKHITRVLFYAIYF